MSPDPVQTKVGERDREWRSNLDIGHELVNVFLARLQTTNNKKKIYGVESLPIWLEQKPESLSCIENVPISSLPEPGSVIRCDNCLLREHACGFVVQDY